MVAAIDAASEDGVSAAIATCPDADEGADPSAGSGLSAAVNEGATVTATVGSGLGPDTSEDMVLAAAAGVDATMGAGVSAGAAIDAGATVATAANASSGAKADSSTRA